LYKELNIFTKTNIMADKFKKKLIGIEIEISDLSKLSEIFNQLNSELCDGNESKFEFTEHYNLKYKMEFVEKTEYIEKEIDGKFYQVIKSKKR
jgi:hypothetical protein